MPAQVTEVYNPVDRSQMVIRRHAILDREIVEQRPLRDLPRPHHRQIAIA
jgi:hypothetical protein